jgi:HPt (histidine-containing phosphotransfer) domain-containing protein
MKVRKLDLTGTPQTVATPARSPVAVRYDVLDADTLASIRELEEPGDTSLLEEMVDTFRTWSVGQLEQLRYSTAAGDMDAIADGAHALKGAAAALGAVQVRRLALEIEQSARQRSYIGEAKLEALEAACVEALAALDQLLNDASATPRSLLH